MVFHWRKKQEHDGNILEPVCFYFHVSVFQYIIAKDYLQKKKQHKYLSLKKRYYLLGRLIELLIYNI